MTCSAWIELDPLLTDDDPVAAEVAAANIWECPNLALIDDRWVLLISLWRWVDGAHQLAGVRYLVGDLVRASRRPAVPAVVGRHAGRRARVLCPAADDRR